MSKKGYVQVKVNGMSYGNYDLDVCKTLTVTLINQKTKQTIKRTYNLQAVNKKNFDVTLNDANNKKLSKDWCVQVKGGTNGAGE